MSSNFTSSRSVSSDPASSNPFPSNSSPAAEAWSDKLTIETPEQTVFDFPLAGVGSRALALIIDTLIQIIAAVVVVVIMALTQAANRFAGINLGIWAEAIAILIVFCLYYGYFAFFEAIWNGQTPGKRWIHVRVIHESGRPIGVPQAIARNLIRFIDQLPGTYAVGLTSALISRQNRRVGDYVAGTVVVHERPLEKGRAAWAAAGTAGGNAASSFSAPSILGVSAPPSVAPSASAVAADPGAVGSSSVIRFGANQLSGDEVRILTGFLERRFTLDYASRDRLAKQIAERLAARLNISFEQRRAAGVVRYEDFLEALARERQR